MVPGRADSALERSSMRTQHKIRTLFSSACLIGIALVLACIALPGGPVKANSAPPPPSDLTALALSVQKVVLDWSAAEADPALIRYSIRRNDVRIAVVSGQQHSYIDTEVQAGTPYTYTVRAIADNDASLASNSASVQVPSQPDTPDLTPPSAPGMLTAVISGSSVLLDWYDASDDSDITAYLVRRDGIPLALVPPGTLSYQDNTAQPGTAYTYTVEAIDVVEHYSQPSNPITITL